MAAELDEAISVVKWAVTASPPAAVASQNAVLVVQKGAESAVLVRGAAAAVRSVLVAENPVDFLLPPELALEL